MYENLVGHDFEKQAAEIKSGKPESTYGIWRHVWHFAEYLHSLKYKHKFRKKIYILLLLLTGWIGGHRYYQGRYWLGAIYTALAWTGLPVALCVTDLMEAVPITPDSEGYIVL